MLPITIVCFKWKNLSGKRMLPGLLNEYTGKHVNILYNMIWRNISIPFRFICVTDDDHDIDPRIETIPLWDKCRVLGGCFNRLFVFSPEMKDLFGPRFACIDLDVVITGDITSILKRKEDFIINKYVPCPGITYSKKQDYNGGFFIMDAGCRSKVWNSFDAEESPRILNDEKIYIGTDQAWIRRALGPGEIMFDKSDGVYEGRIVKDKLPGDARIVLLAGKRDPSLSNFPWVKEHWR